MKIMSKPRLQSIKSIATERGCSLDRARSLRALMEVRADAAHYHKTGVHFLETVTPKDLMRRPELASQ